MTCRANMFLTKMERVKQREKERRRDRTKFIINVNVWMSKFRIASWVYELGNVSLEILLVEESHKNILFLFLSFSLPLSSSRVYSRARSKPNMLNLAFDHARNMFPVVGQREILCPLDAASSAGPCAILALTGLYSMPMTRERWPYTVDHWLTTLLAAVSSESARRAFRHYFARVLRQIRIYTTHVRKRVRFF